MNKKIVKWIDKTFYPNHQNNWDDRFFREEILKIENRKSLKLLDVGAGAGIVMQMNFKDEFAEVIGIDPDKRVVDNQYLDKGYVGLADNMPMFEDNYFDVIISDNVFEHIDNPDAVFSEVKRVLKMGGVLMAKTPNKYHYMPLIATYTPTWFHKFYNKLRGRKSIDTFPTRYLLNSKKDLSIIAEKNAFLIEYIKFYEGRPEYLRIFFFTYIFGILYEKIVNIFSLNQLKILIIVKMRKSEKK